MIDILTQKKLAELAEEYESIKQMYPWQWFTPLPKQAEFQRYVGNKFQAVLFQGGNWTGKTITGANTALQLAFSGGIRVGNDFYPVCDVPNMGRIATEKELVEKDVIRHLEKQLGPGTYNTEKKGRPFFTQWYLENGSEFDILTYDQDPKQFEGVELDWAWLNEPSTEDIFKRMLGRFKKGGVLFITATILSCPWILDLIIEADNPRYKIVTMDIEENKESKGGYLPDKAVDDMLASQDPEEREARKSGRSLRLAGRVFKYYEKHRHEIFIEMRDEAPDDMMVIMATDPHDKLPHYSAWAYLDNDGILNVYKEHPNSNFWEFSDNPWANEYQLADVYRGIEDVEPVRRLLDKKFGNTAKFGQKLTVKEMLYEAGLVYEDWDGSSQAAHNKKIRSWLEMGKIRISTSCVNMDLALRRHRYLSPTSSRAKDEKGQREDSDKKYRHPIDVLAALIEAFDDGAMNANVVDLRQGIPRVEEDEEQRIRRVGAEAVFGKGVVMPAEDIYSVEELFL